MNDAMRLFREAFVIAVEDKSPFAKQALAQADKAADLLRFQHKKLIAIREALGRGEVSYAKELADAALIEDILSD